MITTIAILTITIIVVEEFRIYMLKDTIDRKDATIDVYIKMYTETTQKLYADLKEKTSDLTAIREELIKVLAKKKQPRNKKGQFK